MSLLVGLVVVPLGQIIDKLPRAEQEPPKAFAENGRLPGKPPGADKDVHGTWQFGYEDGDVLISDRSRDVIISMQIQLEPDGSYHFTYAARWGNPPVRGKDAGGKTIDEIGTYKLSGDVLILDPTETLQADLEKNKVVRREPIHSEKHIYVIHWESKRIHLVGSCAKFQIDAICQDYNVENVWFTLKGSSRRMFSR